MDPVVPIEFHFHALMQEGQSGYSRLPCGWEQEGLVLSLVSDCLLNALLERVYAAFLPHYEVCYLNARGFQAECV